MDAYVQTRTCTYICAYVHVIFTWAYSIMLLILDIKLEVLSEAIVLIDPVTSILIVTTVFLVLSWFAVT